MHVNNLQTAMQKVEIERRKLKFNCMCNINKQSNYFLVQFGINQLCKFIKDYKLNITRWNPTSALHQKLLIVQTRIEGHRGNKAFWIFDISDISHKREKLFPCYDCKLLKQIQG